jgi:hypothetical protein
MSWCVFLLNKEPPEMAAFFNQPETVGIPRQQGEAELSGFFMFTNT